MGAIGWFMHGYGLAHWNCGFSMWSDYPWRCDDPFDIWDFFRDVVVHLRCGSFFIVDVSLEIWWLIIDIALECWSRWYSLFEDVVVDWDKVLLETYWRCVGSLEMLWSQWRSGGSVETRLRWSSSVDLGLRLSGSVEMWWPSEDLAAQFRRGWDEVAQWI